MFNVRVLMFVCAGFVKVIMFAFCIKILQYFGLDFKIKFAPLISILTELVMEVLKLPLSSLLLLLLNVTRLNNHKLLVDALGKAPG